MNEKLTKIWNVKIGETLCLAIRKLPRMKRLVLAEKVRRVLEQAVK